MNAHELEFRKELIKAMGACWVPTIHVESDLNPGVPDLSFVMVHPDCETGWLELKSSPTSSRTHIWGVRQSQHFWMMRHAHRIPAYFLLTDPHTCWLVEGKYHEHLDSSITSDELNQLGTPMDRKNIQQSLRRLLIAATQRKRNGA